MNVKPLAMLAITGVALSFAYIAPAMADDMNPAAQAQPTAGQEPQAQAPASDNNSMQTASNSINNPASPVDASTANPGSADEGTPDTATGDDDY